MIGRNGGKDADEVRKNEVRKNIMHFRRINILRNVHVGEKEVFPLTDDPNVCRTFHYDKLMKIIVLQLISLLSFTLVSLFVYYFKQ